MEAPRKVLGRQQKRSKWLWWAVGAAVVVALIVIIVPPAVIIPERETPSGSPATVLVPLYAYPVDNAWDPLWNAIDSSPEQKFMVIINPDSGPGTQSRPNEDFTPSIERLNAYENVQMVGYVRTGYGSRPINDILRDVETYGNWSGIDPRLAMHGVFFDEAAYEYDVRVAADLSAMNQAVKKSTGIRGHRTVIHNPGVVPDAKLNVNNTDITVTFEQSKAEYHKLHSSLEASSLPRSATAYIAHSAGEDGLRKFVAELSQGAGYIFVSTLKHDYYGSLQGDFEKFVDVMPD